MLLQPSLSKRYSDISIPDTPKLFEKLTKQSFESSNQPLSSSDKDKEQRLIEPTAADEKDSGPEDNEAEDLTSKKKKKNKKKKRKKKKNKKGKDKTEEEPPNIKQPNEENKKRENSDDEQQSEIDKIYKTLESILLPK